MMSEYAKEIIEAYFRGGNAKDSHPDRIKETLEVIIKIVDEEEERE